MIWGQFRLEAQEFNGLTRPAAPRPSPAADRGATI